MLLHYVEALDRGGWYQYPLTFPSPYSAEQYAKERRAANHTVRVVDEESGAEPAYGGVVSAAQWEGREAEKQAHGFRFELSVAATDGPHLGASVDWI